MSKSESRRVEKLREKSFGAKRDDECFIFECKNEVVIKHPPHGGPTLTIMT